MFGIERSGNKNIMVSPCIVEDCRNIGTHRIPSNEIRKKQWIKAIKHIRNPCGTIWKHTLICSSHFRSADFIRTSMLVYGRKILKKDAIPSIFPWNSETITNHDERKKERSILLTQKTSKNIRENQNKKIFKHVVLCPKPVLAQHNTGNQHDDDEEEELCSTSSEETVVFEKSKVERTYSRIPTSTEETVVFEKSKVERTYSRIPRVTIMDQLTLSNTESESIEDPLQLIKQEIKVECTDADETEVTFTQNDELYTYNVINYINQVRFTHTDKINKLS